VESPGTVNAFLSDSERIDAITVKGGKPIVQVSRVTVPPITVSAALQDSERTPALTVKGGTLTVKVSKVTVPPFIVSASLYACTYTVMQQPSHFRRSFSEVPTAVADIMCTVGMKRIETNLNCHGSVVRGSSMYKCIKCKNKCINKPM
jgi:hypothetical protein